MSCPPFVDVVEQQPEFIFVLKVVIYIRPELSDIVPVQKVRDLRLGKCNSLRGAVLRGEILGGLVQQACHAL